LFSFGLSWWALLRDPLLVGDVSLKHQQRLSGQWTLGPVTLLVPSFPLSNTNNGSALAF